eukprot:GHVP01057909.1.p1 GENE.GHVP01057909.1~~GHVP01057909.1.p1  ORF type:complete len:337 (+),score=67.65 GHVP01057909.1:4947-5957(+)
MNGITFSHLSRWIFPSSNIIKKFRQNARDGAVARLGLSLDQIPPLEDEAILVSYFAETAVNVCQQKSLDYRTTVTAVTLLQRFYLNRSALLYDPRKLLFCCIVIAIKVEEQSNQLTVGSIFGGVEKKFDISEIFGLELEVLAAVNFDLLILTTRTPLQLITNEYHQYLKKNRSSESRTEGYEKEIEEIVKGANSEAEKLSTATLSTDLEFCYSPAQIACAVFQHVTAGQPQSAAFMRNMLRNNAGDTPVESIEKVIHDICIKLLEYEEMKRVGWAKDPSVVIRGFEKIYRLEKKRRKAQQKMDGSTDKAPKKAKSEDQPEDSKTEGKSEESEKQNF